MRCAWIFPYLQTAQLSKTQFLVVKSTKEDLQFSLIRMRIDQRKFPLLMIRNSQRPRCFQKNSGTGLVFHYEANKRSWMTMSIFFYWLKIFDAYTSCPAGGKVLLLLNNFSGHVSSVCLPKFSSVSVKHLPEASVLYIVMQWNTWKANCCCHLQDWSTNGYEMFKRNSDHTSSQHNPKLLNKMWSHNCATD